ncbi:hypothetical protein F5Y13DRAFT_160068, partial [Hypoxylon sp. FL1857]
MYLEYRRYESHCPALAAKVARLIPRINTWGIIGTPVKGDIKALWGLLVFLHCEPFASCTAVWDRLITSHKEFFQPLFNRIALRHTKRAVRNELTLPPQKRYVITMPFTAVEEEHYQAINRDHQDRCLRPCRMTEARNRARIRIRRHAQFLL